MCINSTMFINTYYFPHSNVSFSFCDIVDICNKGTDICKNITE